MFRLLLPLTAFLLAAPLAAQTSLVAEGRAALDRRDPQTAVILLEKAVAQNRANAATHYLLGVAYGTLAEKADVFRRASLARHTRDEFERAVRIDPDNLDARFALVEFYSMAPRFLGGSRQKALQQAEEIRKRDPKAGESAFAFLDDHR
jgi:tetratricopeptide (TPR) repeat protein